MAATENGVFTNHTEEVQVNGHNLEEKPPTKKIHEEKPYNEKLFQHETSQVNGYPEQESLESTLSEDQASAQDTSQAVEDVKFVDEDSSSFSNGPDQILPADTIWTSEKNGRVKLRLEGATGVAAEPPVSVPGLLHRTATNYPDHVALSFKDSDGMWRNTTYKEYEENVRAVAKAFLNLGLTKYHGVCIIGFNSPEWFYSNLGAIYAGGFAVGMYTTNNSEACHHCLQTSEANICIVEDDKQLQKILSIRNTLLHLKAIVQYNGKPTVPDVLSWEDVMELGKKEDDSKLEATLMKIAINECCTLVFTSGTEGKSKAVMLSHDNITWNAFSVQKYLELNMGEESIVSYLPLSHVAAQIADIYISITVAAKTVFADSDALKGSLVKTLGEVRPTVFLGVPRVWEKIHEKMVNIGAQTTGLKKMIATWGKQCCLQHHINVTNGDSTEHLNYKFYRWLIFNRIKAALGFDKTKIFMSAAAPLSTDVKKYFMSIDIPVTDAFGMSETGGPHTLSKPDDFQVDSIGQAIIGAESKVDNPSTDRQGELCMRGRHVFMGYLGEPEKTKVTLDLEGWLHSGDIGTIDERKHLRITGRIKELLITAGGENVPPVVIEHTLKQELPCVSNAQLIGDKRKFLSILLTLKTEMDPDTGAPLDELTPEVKNWCKRLGCEVKTVSEVLQGPKKEVMDALQAGIERANKKAVSNAQKVQKFALLPADFSVTTGELGPTLKLKRNVVYEKYTDIIENFYK